MLKLIIFDYDGVIVDSIKTAFEAYKVMSKELGFECPPDIDAFRALWERYGNYPEILAAYGVTGERFIRSQEIYRDHIVGTPSPFMKGIWKTIGKLHDTYQLAIVSGSFLQEVKQKIGQKASLFKDIIAKAAPGKSISKADEIRNVLKDLNLSPNEALYIGDMDNDAIESAKVGIPCILVGYGWGYNTEKYPQKNHIKEPKGLLDAIAQIDKEAKLK